MVWHPVLQNLQNSKKFQLHVSSWKYASKGYIDVFFSQNQELLKNVKQILK